MLAAARAALDEAMAAKAQPGASVLVMARPLSGGMMPVAVKRLKLSDLPTLVVKLSGRETLWGKTKKMFLQTEHLATNYDWVLKVKPGQGWCLIPLVVCRRTMTPSSSWRISGTC